VSQSIIFLLLALVWAGYLAMWWRDTRGASGRRERTPSMAAGIGALAGAARRPSRTGPPLASPRPVPAGSTSSPIALTSASPARNLRPSSPDEAAQRRREVGAALAALAAVTLLAALVVGPLMWAVHVVVDVALVAFVVACAQRTQQAAEREMAVTMLYPDRPSAAPVPAHAARLQRTAHG